MSDDVSGREPGAGTGDRPARRSTLTAPLGLAALIGVLTFVVVWGVTRVLRDGLIGAGVAFVVSIAAFATFQLTFRADPDPVDLLGSAEDAAADRQPGPLHGHDVGVRREGHEDEPDGRDDAAAGGGPVPPPAA